MNNVRFTMICLLVLRCKKTHQFSNARAHTHIQTPSHTHHTHRNGYGYLYL